MAEITETEVTPVSTPGAFEASLKRNNAKIRADRAIGITEDAQMRYQRTIQDMEMEIKRLRRTRENMLDLSPENTYSLMVADNFDSNAFVTKDIQLGVDIRNLDIKIEIAKAQYKYLFGTEI